MGTWIDWALKAGTATSDSDYGYSVASDGLGGAFITGRTDASAVATFGSTLLSASTSTNGVQDVFVFHVTSAGVIDWAVRTTASSPGTFPYTAGYGITSDGSGGALITGAFDGTVTFGTTTLTSSAASSAFVMHVTSTGVIDWAVEAGDSASFGTASGRAIAADGSGGAFVTGGFYGTASFGSTSLTAAGQEDVFVMHVTSSGVIDWAVGAGGEAYDLGYGIDSDGAGGCLVTGGYGRYGSGMGTISASFGATSLTYTAGMDENIFVMRVSSSAVVTWAIQAGGPGRKDVGLSIAYDSSLGAFVSGTFQETASFGATSLTSSRDTTMPSSSSTYATDAFVMHISIATGAVNWAFQLGADTGYFDTGGYGIASDGTGGALLTAATSGWGGSTTHCYGVRGSATWSDSCFQPMDYQNVYTMRLSSAGGLSWSTRASGATLAGHGIASDGSGGCLVTGSFSGTGSFGPSNPLTAAGSGRDVFMIRVGTAPEPGPPPPWHPPPLPVSPTPSPPPSPPAGITVSPSTAYILDATTISVTGMVDGDTIVFLPTGGTGVPCQNANQLQDVQGGALTSGQVSVTLPSIGSYTACVSSARPQPTSDSDFSLANAQLDAHYAPPPPPQTPAVTATVTSSPIPFIIVGGVLGLFAVFLVLFLLYRLRNHRKARQYKEAIDREYTDLKDTTDEKRPYFYFVEAQYVRSFQSTPERPSPPMMQTLRKAGLLKRIDVDLAQAFRGQGIINKILFISHRWEERGEPDTTGAQLKAVQEYLLRPESSEIEYVWYDFWCMAQRGAPESKPDVRSPREKAEMKLMLEAMTFLYASAQVLILLDTQYIGRFWTLTEAWCSMQTAEPRGLRPAADAEKRFAVACIHSADSHLQESLEENREKSNLKMAEMLAQPDIHVTNAHDKEAILPIMRGMNDTIAQIMKETTDVVGEPAFTPVEVLAPEETAGVKSKLSMSSVRIAPAQSEKGQ